MKKASVYVTRVIPQETIDELRNHCHGDVNPEDRALTKAEVKEKAKGRDAIISLITDTIDGELLDAVGPQCRIVANYAVGINNFDLAAATKREEWSLPTLPACWTTLGQRTRLLCCSPRPGV